MILNNTPLGLEAWLKQIECLSSKHEGPEFKPSTAQKKERLLRAGCMAQW
jgi:hypothetical protein